MEASFPIINISQISDEDHQESIAQHITNACKEWGFLLLQGHQIPEADIEELFSLSKTFFSFPEHEKRKWQINDRYIGYTGPLEDGGNADNESVWFGGIPGALEDDRTSLPPFWQGGCAEKIEALKHKCHQIVIQILQCFAIALRLEDRNYFANSHAADSGNGNALRTIWYPAREKPLAEADSRLVPHTDSGSVTLLFQNVAGLEVESPDGTWVRAPCERNHVLLNLGDSLSLWSGGVLKATRHRITFDSLPHDQTRQSMAYFARAAPETKLDPIRGPQRTENYNLNTIDVYPGITAGEYTKLTMEMLYGKRVEIK